MSKKKRKETEIPEPECCQQCGAAEATFAEDPYAAEICNNHTPVWLCKTCRANNCDDI